MEEIVVKLDNINQTLKEMLQVMKKPENRFLRVLEIIGLGVGTLSALSAADIVKNWITGG